MVGRRGRFQGTFFSQVGARREKEIEQGEGDEERGKEKQGRERGRQKRRMNFAEEEEIK